MSSPSKPVSRNVNAPFKSPLRSAATREHLTSDSGSQINKGVTPVNRPVDEAAMRAEIARLTEQLAQDQTEPFDPEQELALWMKRLHAYNEAKDACLQLFGLLAHAKGCLVRDLYAEFGLDLTD